jgi:hypothetical protein
MEQLILLGQMIKPILFSFMLLGSAAGLYIVANVKK